MGGTNVEFTGDSSDMNRAIQDYVDNHMDGDDEFMYSEAHDEDHAEWYGDAEYDNYYDWE